MTTTPAEHEATITQTNYWNGTRAAYTVTCTCGIVLGASRTKKGAANLLAWHLGGGDQKA